MSKYISQRLLLLGPTLLGVSVIIFGLLRLMPGDVATTLLSEGGNYSPEAAQRLRHQLRLDDPVLKAYPRWIGDVLTGNFGKSLYTGRPVIADLKKRLPVTAELATLTLLLSMATGMTIGAAAALGRGRRIDGIIRVLISLGLALPTFLTGTLLIVLPARWFGYVPQATYVSFWAGPLSHLRIMLAPVLALSLFSWASVAKMTRTSLLDVLRMDYVRTARAKGLSERVLLIRHALRNALIPVITIFGLQLGNALAGAVIVENIFGIPGMGNLIINAAERRDYTIVQAGVLIIAAWVAIVNLLIDLTYAVINPSIGKS
jgi:peptide/nickel transport system permease protein